MSLKVQDTINIRMHVQVYRNGHQGYVQYFLMEQLYIIRCSFLADVSVMLNESSYVVTEGETVVVCVEVTGQSRRDIAVNITTVQGTAIGIIIP